MGLGMWEILVVTLVVLLLFGARRIPEIARSLGSGVTEFKKGLHGDEDGSKLPDSGAEPESS